MFHLMDVLRLIAAARGQPRPEPDPEPDPPPRPRPPTEAELSVIVAEAYGLLPCAAWPARRRLARYRPTVGTFGNRSLN